METVACGGDTDTTAAIVGGIVGSGVGKAGIPPQWISGIREWPRTVAWMERLAEGFQKNELSYLLFLRLVPLFPFFVVNLVPAFLGVRLRDYVLATFVGIIPGTFVYNLAGAGLGSILDTGEDFTVSSVLTPEVKLALFGLAALALLPVVYKQLKARRQ